MKSAKQYRRLLLDGTMQMLKLMALFYFLLNGKLILLR